MPLKWWKKKKWTLASQASQENEQKLEEDQLDGVHGLSQRWASLSSDEGWENQVQEEDEEEEKEEEKEEERKEGIEAPRKKPSRPLVNG